MHPCTFIIETLLLQRRCRDPSRLLLFLLLLFVYFWPYHPYLHVHVHVHSTSSIYLVAFILVCVHFLVSVYVATKCEEHGLVTCFWQEATV